MCISQLLSYTFKAGFALVVPSRSVNVLLSNAVGNSAVLADGNGERSTISQALLI